MELVDEVGEGQNLSHFEFKIESSPMVIFETDGNKTYIKSCSCKHCSIYGGMPEVLCSYKVAVIKSLG